jgi:HAE1 family hydrophobic/amphiphilic exporter-1
MGILIIMVLGVFSVTRLPLTLFPEIELPYIVTITDYVGASPEEVEAEIARPIESAVSTIGNFKEVSSISNENFGISIITFADAANMEAVVIELRELINNTAFDEGVGNTRILRISPDMLPVMTVTLFRDYEEDLTDEEALIKNTEWIQRDLLLDLQAIPGIADVSISGAADVILEVDLDPAVISSYGITNQEVLEIIERQNVSGLIGVALDDGEIRMLYLGNKPSSLSDIENLPILFDAGSVIKIKDLVKEDGIRFVNANSEVYSKINGIQGIQISFTKQSDYGITEVTKNITDKLDMLMDREGEQAHYTILLDQGEYINQSISSVLQNIIFGSILAILILFLFLRDIKPTLIVGLAIPISVITAFMLMYFTNVSLNLVSMGGLALGIGMLVDNAIVVIENIYRMISEGLSKKDAAIAGAKQVVGAITASTLTTAAVFLPIFFIEGFIADVFISMALTIAYSLGASLLIALTLVPTMASRMLSDQKIKKESKGLKKIKSIYQKSVVWTIHHKLVTILIVLLLFGGSVWAVAAKGFILLPQSDEGSISVDVSFTSQTEFDAKAVYADLLTEELQALDDIETISASIGGSGGFGMFMFGSGSSDLSMTINLKEGRKQSTAYYTSEIAELISTFDFDQIEGLNEDNLIEVVVDSQNSTAALAGAQGVNVKVAGYDLETLRAISNDLVTVLHDIEGVTNIDGGITQGADTIKVTVDLDQAMTYSLTHQDVMNSISYLYTNLESLGAVQRLTVTIEGINYELDLPSETVSGGFSFDLFGNYETFLSGILLFDETTQIMIDNYIEETDQSIYVPNMVLPGYTPGDPILFVVNPYLKITGGELMMDPFSADPALTTMAKAPLFIPDDDTSVTDIEKIPGFAVINTDGTNRYFNVTADVEEGYNVTRVGSKVTEAVNDYLSSEAYASYGGGYYVTLEGESEEILKAVRELTIAALVAILLVYMIMAIQFQSLVYPLIILSTIPLAFTGGMLSLLITNSYLSLVSIMGLIILVGVVVNNGIVLIDYIRILREEGMSVKKAIIEAGKTRIRPIFMTALTTILGLITLAFGFGEGAELLQPMAITAIGGLLYGTLLTLVVVPTIYAAINWKKIREEEHADNQG